MPIPEDYKEIIKDLSQATAEGRVLWRDTKYGIEIKVSNSKFELWSGEDEDTGIPFISFALSDLFGRRLDGWYVEKGEAEFEFMHLFFSNAKRKASGIDERLTSIKEVIKASKIIGDTTSDEDEIPF